MDQETIEKFRAILLDLRKQLNGAYKRAVEASGEEFGGDVPDINDEATRTINRRILLEMGDRSFETAQLVEDALERIERGEFGECVECGEEIPEKRLELIPYAEYCVECKERMER